ncbi:MAG: PqqD family peptide modification chaperone [Victivallaceae bacterium]|nr:PqqD family peptide modification chaperone [Victivallaceae bacterium]
MKLNPLIVFRDDFGENAVLFNPEDGKVLGLNRTGAFVWKCLEKQMDRAAILASLREACGDTVPETMESDVDAFLGELRKRAFLVD